MKKKNYIFLLGGSDLEMVEIKRILKRKKETFIDRNLTWQDASWKSFQDLFTLPEYADKTFVGIELQDKKLKPKHAIDIDHHGEMEGKPSALEQVLDLLGMTDSLTKRMRFIAANDMGYIPAMRELGATQAEIDKIRREDRKAQGVTDTDEQLAEKAILENSETYAELTVVHAYNGKFSPITDRLYDKSKEVLVYTDQELTYYGENRDKVADLFRAEIENESAYKGGGENGYFGLKEGKWSESEIVCIKDQIVTALSAKEKIHSHHIFLFPFKWENTEQNNLFDLSVFNELLADRWESKLFDIKGLDRFNEFNYFFEHVREMLYETDKSLTDAPSDNQFTRHFEYKKENNSTYNIRIKKYDIDGVEIAPKIYSLAIDTIILNVYKMGTAVMSFHLLNHTYQDPQEILEINKFGRRIAVPFFDLKPDSIYSGKADQSSEDNDHDILYGTKGYEIPDAIWIGNSCKKSEKVDIFEDFTPYLESGNYQKNTFILARHIKNLFPKKFIKDQNSSKGKIALSLVLDDRMHVISWYGNTDQTNQLNKVVKDVTNNVKDNLPFYSYVSSEWWQNYVFVDTGGVFQTNRFIRKAQLETKTYSRFVEFGTLFGVSRYSFVMVTSSFSDLEKYQTTYVVRHLQSMYYKMVELCLLQRATILRFSDETAELSQEVFALSNKEKKGKSPAKISKDITNLYRRYIFFVNRIYFREITPQEQGIELYDMLQENMRLPQEVKSLDEEIRELNAFVEMENNRRSADEQARLSIVATALLLPALVAGIAGMNTLPPPTWEITSTPYWPFWSNLILVLVFIPIAVIIIKIWRKKSKR